MTLLIVLQALDLRQECIVFWRLLYSDHILDLPKSVVS